MGGFEVKNRLLVCLVSLYPKRYSIIVRRGNGGTAYNKGTTTAHTHTHARTRTRNVDLLHTAKAIQTAGETVASGETHTQKERQTLIAIL